MKFDKSKIVKYAGAGVLSVCVIAGSGIYFKEKNVDHVNEYCPLNGILGIEHQIEKANAQLSSEYRAYAVENHKADLYSDFITENGESVLPEGYVLDGNVGVKTINVENEDAVIITKSSIVSDEFDNSKYYNPEIVKVLYNTKSR